MMMLKHKQVILFITLIITVSCSHKNQESIKFVQLCDTQLGMGGYEHDKKTFRQAVVQINSIKPDFVVICGDLVHDAADSSFSDFLEIKSEFDVPCHVAAGNHDVGKHPTVATLNYYRNTIGRDYYKFTSKGYTFIVTNSQLWKANVEEESERHDHWFKKTLRESGKEDNSVFVIGHYPLFTETPDEEEHYFNLPIEKRSEILELLQQHNVPVYLSGHKHEKVVNTYKNIQLVSGESTSKNLDGTPLGFRLWTITADTSIHRFISLNNHSED